MRRTQRLSKDQAATITVASKPGEIIARVLDGDSEAFRELVRQHYAAVFGLCRRLLFSRESEAEEVTQDTFFNAFKHLSRLEQPDRFSSWLYQIARSLCRDRRRRWKVETRALMERAELLRRRGLERVPKEEEYFLDSALRDLPAQQREALYLKYFEGLSYGEIARHMQLSFSRVDHLIRKARARLARRLAVRERGEHGSPQLS
jgi:RNA polymerase sigma-70 factor (ECF subfamily)